MKNELGAPRRVFVDTLSVEAWYDAFAGDSKRADLRVDVTFRKGVPVGAEPESPVRFRLSLKRAEIVVIIPDNGTLGVDQNSVARDAPVGSGRSTNTAVSAKEGIATGEIGGSIRSGVDVVAKVRGETKQSISRSTELNQTVRLMMVLHSAVPNGHAWEIKPTVGEALEGKPWDVKTEPRLQLIDKRKDCSTPLPESIIVEARCRREDLDIQDIELKNDKNSFISRKKNNIAAAEGYIRSQFEKSGLDVDIGSMDEKFLRLVLTRIEAIRNETM